MPNFTFVNILGDTLDVEANDLESARRIAAKKLTKHPLEEVFSVEEVASKWDAFFPEGSFDVVEIVDPPEERVRVIGQYRIAGFDIVWMQRASGRESSVTGFEFPARFLLIRIPEDGKVCCPSQFMGRVIGKGGSKIRELSEEHGVTVTLVEV